ncbi:ChbG/HpnK family deacetylase [Ottowia sp. GY511]|nr:ChbG/HpnK family deacetylase [Ottowia sp. GY511]
MTACTLKPLVLCADDYAQSAGISAAIRRLAGMGRLTATSAMVLSPRWPQDAAALAPLRGHIDVGLHLDWTSPFAQARGHGMGLQQAMRRALIGGFDRTAARAEIERQLDAFEAAWGAPPDHVDGHQHVQQFAGIRQALVDSLRQRYGGQARPPWLRLSCAPAGQRDLKARIIGALGGNSLKKLAARVDLPTATALSGIYNFEGSTDAYAAHMARWLAGSAAGTVLMCHPGDAQASGTAEPDDPIALARKREAQFLASERFAAQLAQHRIQLVRGSTLFSGTT